MPDQNQPNLDQSSLSIWPTAWKYALIITAFNLIYSLLFLATALEGPPGTGLIAVIITIVLLVIGLRSYRRLNDGYMTFGQGFGIAFVASAVSAVVNAAATAVYLAAFGQEQLEARLEAGLSQLRANPAVDPAMLDMVTGFVEALFTPTGIFFSSAIGSTILWTIVSLILAAVVKKPPPVTP